MSKPMNYDLRGVSADKTEVHEAIKHLDKGLYPDAFCKIIPDLVAGDPDYCNIMHADTAGTKTALAFLWWKETGDISVWKGIAQDAIAMNVDDMACVGCIDNIVLSSTIGRNKNLISGSVISELISANEEFCERMRDYGINITIASGETADVGDIVRTLDVGITAFARMKRSQVITNNIKDGDVVVGFSSYGQASYEDQYNGGMGSNGLTSARHDILQHGYAAKYPDTFDQNTSRALIYCGTRDLKERIRIDGKKVTIGEMILSPTRTYLPLLKEILKQHRDRINGIIHCSGGGQTKVLRFLNKVKVVKERMLPIPPLFGLIEEESNTSRQEMYKVFNMGHRLEVYTDPATAKELVDIASGFNIVADIVGHVEASHESEVVISDAQGTYHYGI